MHRRILVWLAGATGLLAAAFLATGSTAIALAPSDAGGGSSTPAMSPTDPEYWPAWIQGQPENFRPGGPNGWYFWHDGSGLHIRTTNPSDKNHVFTAVLTTGGTFADIQKVRLESNDDIRLLDNGHRLVVRFHTYDGVDGVNFHVVGGDRLRLRFDEAGKLIGPDRIYAGAEAIHPASDPFTVNR